MELSKLLSVVAGIAAPWLLIPIARADSTLTTIIVFNGTNGAKPSSGLLLSRDGSFYGTTLEGGVNGMGTIYNVTPQGRFTVLASFDGSLGKGPCGGLIQGNEGTFFGTAIEGGKSGNGVVFKMTSDGRLTVLFSFSEYNETGGESLTGLAPSQIVAGDDGYFYGTTGRSHFGLGRGTVFRISPTGAFSTLATFDSGAEAAWLVSAANGHHYFTTASLGFRLAPLSTISSVKRIDSLNTLVQGKDGCLYGTTAEGGPKGGGTVFRMTVHGATTNLVSFDVNNSVNGRTPFAELTEGKDGCFYGTTFAGDTNGPPPDISKFLTRNASGAWVLINTNRPFPGVKPDLGTVFRMTTNGTITTLAVFNRTNGCYPTARLVQGKDGAFYGTTTEGGVGPNPSGTIFRITVSPPASSSAR